MIDLRRWSFDCECGPKATFRTCAADGMEVWAQCQDCSSVHRLLLPGEYVGRKPRADTQRIRDAIFDVFREMLPRLTVRQVYYQLAVKGLVPKEGKGYRKAQYQLKTARRLGILPYGWIADNTRWQISPTTYTGLESAMQIWNDAYRRNLWESQGVHVEIWVEKDALAGVLKPVTWEYQVPLYVARGFSSMTFAYDAAEEIRQIDKPTYIYHFGDFDPSGVSAAEALQAELDRHGCKAYFQRMAVTAQQVDALELPTLKVNRKDSRAKTWPYGYVCELDAFPPNVLRQLVRACIEGHIDAEKWNAEKETERAEALSFAMMRAYFVQEPDSDDLTGLAHKTGIR